jgi:hypothetical protein
MRGPTPPCYPESSDSHRRCAFDRPLLKHRRYATEHRVELTAKSAHSRDDRDQDTSGTGAALKTGATGYHVQSSGLIPVASLSPIDTMRKR